MTDVLDMDEVLFVEENYGPGVWKDGFYFHPLYTNAHTAVKKVLESGQFEGVPFAVTSHGTDIQPGDTYIVERDGEVQLLTCAKVYRELGWVYAIENADSYDTRECTCIELIID